MATSTTSAPALEAHGVVVSLSGLTILREASLRVAPGEVHVLIGPNGAGKTTLANAITGHAPIASGSVTLGGRPLRGSAMDRTRAGVGRKFQVPRVFARLTVEQNLAIAGHRRRDRDQPLPDLVADLSPGADVETLSHGQRQRLELQMVLAQSPAVCVLDEPTAGMTAEERDELAALLRRLVPEQTFLVVEHDMDFVAAAADTVSFMRDGQVVRTGSHDEIMADEEVRAAYLGESAPGGPAPEPITVAAPPASSTHGALSVSGLSVRHGRVVSVRDVDFELAPGQALGILGRNGAGKSTLLEGIAGTLPLSGSITLDGEQIAGLPAWDRATRGIALVAQGRRLFRDLSVDDNLRLAQSAPPGPGEHFDVHELFPALRDLGSRAAGLLSGGEQQQVAIAQALLRRPTVLLLDEPTEGIAPIITEGIVAVLGELVARGLSIVLADQHRSLVERLCTHFIALRAGLPAGGGEITATALDNYDQRL